MRGALISSFVHFWWSCPDIETASAPLERLATAGSSDDHISSTSSKTDVHMAYHLNSKLSLLKTFASRCHLVLSFKLVSFEPVCDFCTTSATSMASNPNAVSSIPMYTLKWQKSSWNYTLRADGGSTSAVYNALNAVYTTLVCGLTRPRCRR